ncbi:PQQ-binding-like beta-propeller repeat protein [Limisphaera sp. 4302-co]|uniref:outer membrane protein assembly factor BamB family protein n=1 Tax=Limisphaera sp. 4302-co TaxID=3400417 RepID=UPI003C2A6ABA
MEGPQSFERGAVRCRGGACLLGKRLRRVCGLFLVVQAAGQAVVGGAGRDWDEYLGDPGRSHYSELRQIHRHNVHRLKVAWVYRSGDARTNPPSQIQCNPLVVEGVLYGTSPGLKLFALDAASGRELWRFDPVAAGLPGTDGGINRGVALWKDGTRARLFYIAGPWLLCVDARTGRLVPEFGREGRVDLRDDLGRDARNLYVAGTSPPALYEDLVIVPVRVGEGPEPAAPGHVRAYDARTGRLVWRFHTIPQPGEPGHETWPPDAWRHVGGANCWAGMAVDSRRGIVFVPTGSATYDFWGGDRIGENLYANCLLALDARTGRLLWHFQFVHHDLWDRDLPAPPTLCTVRRNGRLIEAVAQVTKSGHVFVFDRLTGRSLFPVEERPVPASDLPGESAWPTQPFPLRPAPFARQLFTYSEITDRSPAAHRTVLDRFARLRPHVPFQPPSREGTIILPGFDGGAEWGGAAVDPGGVLYVNANEMPWVLTMVEVPAPGSGAVPDGPSLYLQICAACHGTDRKGRTAHGQEVPPLLEIGRKLDRHGFLQLLETGRGGMPSFAFLTPEQKAALADHLLGTGEAASPPAPIRRSATPVHALGRVPFVSTGYHRWLDPDGYPAIKPPWGTLTAIDLNTGEFRWQIPLGEYPELIARGVPPTGTENYGGPLVTAGDLLFIAATRDQKFRAFDRRNGRLLWETRLPAGGYATPATYQVNGRQFVVIACGGGKMGTPAGDAYVAFALPEAD